MLKTLVKLRILEMFSGMKSRSSKGLGVAGMIIILFFVAISMLFLFGTIAVGLAIGLSVTGYKWLYFGIMSIMVFMLSFIGTVFTTKQQMFEAKDNQMLLSMPIEPRNILISRVLSIGVLNYALALLIALPFGVVYAIIGRFSLTGLIFYILGILILPLFALACSMLFGWILAVISKKLRYKNAVTMIFSTVFFIAYFYLCFSWQDRIEELVAHGEEIAAALSKYLPPVYHFGNAIANGSLKSFVISALIGIVPFIVAIILVSKHFIGIVTTETGSAKIEYKAKAMKTSSAFKSLASLELKRFTSSSMYMLNAGMGLLFILMISVVLVINKNDVLRIMNEMPFLSSYIAPIVIAALLYLGSMSIISAGTISLEAKTLWIPKSIPVDPKTVLLSKAYPHIIVSIPIIFISCIIIQFAFEFTIFERIMIMLLPAVSTVFNALLGIVINVKVPKFNWINEAQAIKQGFAPLLAMILSALPAFIFTGLLILVGITKIISVSAFLVLFMFLYILGILLLYKWISKKGAIRFTMLKGN